MPATLPDFNTLKNMAEQDPVGLEQLRQEKINALIESTSEIHRARLRGLQFQIDAQRRLAKNPLQSCLHISRMMHDSFYLLREKLNEVAHRNTLNEPTRKIQTNPKSSAKIIAFPLPR